MPAIPALRGRLASALQDDTGRGTSGRRTAALRSVVAAAELALALVLLVAAGLLLKSLVAVTRVDPGFAAARVMTAHMTLPSARYRDAASRRAFWDALVERTRALPGVETAGLVSTLPFGGQFSAGTYRIVGRDVPIGSAPPHALNDQVAADYFRTMGIPLLAGRFFDDRDGPDAARVVIVDRLFAERRFPGDSPVGRQLNFGSACNYTIVGVVATIPDNLSPYLRVAGTLTNIGKDLPRAERYARTYLSQEPTASSHAVGHWRLALVLEKEGRRADAIAELETAARMDPKFETAQKDLKRLKG